MAWRLQLQRTTSGVWLHTDLPAEAELTVELNGHGKAVLRVPMTLHVAVAADGRRMFLERGTTLVADELGTTDDLPWVGLCETVRERGTVLEVTFRGKAWAFDQIGFDGRIREWEPRTRALVEKLVDNAQAQPAGDLGFVVVAEDLPDDRYAGDAEPPEPRPAKPKRRRNESRQQWRNRRDKRTEQIAAWDKKYDGREPYKLAWWEGQYVGAEIREVCDEVRVDWYERHTWINRADRTYLSELVLTGRRGVRRGDLAVVEGLNLVALADPESDLDRYGNHLVGLGAGEGKKMRRAEVSARDGRVRTTRFMHAKHMHNLKRLRRKVRDRFKRLHAGQRVDSATVRGGLESLVPGDELLVRYGRDFEGWLRVTSITRSNITENVELTFAE